MSKRQHKEEENYFSLTQTKHTLRILFELVHEGVKER